MDIAIIKEQVCDICHKMWQLGWVAANDGNITVKLDDGNFLVTPPGTSKSFITPDILIKVDNPVDVNAAKATFDIQFGNIERTTHNNTTWDYAQFECCGHKWADLSDNSFGLSVLNDCKYGFEINKEVER